MNKTMDEIR